MIQQYLSFKERYPDCILFFRMGDFYEMFFEDAEKASRALGITLTARDKGMPESVPLAGVPYHSADVYLARLVEAGYKVAVCEQVEDPRKAKGIVKRAVTRVITPGTAVSPERLPAKSSRYVVSVASDGEESGLAFLDFSTGEFKATTLRRAEELADELFRLEPAEILVPKSLLDIPGVGEAVREVSLSTEPPVFMDHPEEEAYDPDKARRTLLEHFRADTLEGFGVEGFPQAVRAAGALLYYLRETQEPEDVPPFAVGGDEPITIPNPLSHVTGLSYYSSSDYMVLDESTKRNLELTRTLRDSKPAGSLFWFLDRTVTSMGGRVLRQWLHSPLMDVDRINARLDAVEWMAQDHAYRLDLRSLFQRLSDLERISARIATGSAHARDLRAARETLELIPAIKALAGKAESSKIQEVLEGLDPLEEVVGLLSMALVDEPPSSLRDGGLIRPGYSAEIDELTSVQRDAKSVIAGLEAAERQRSGIPKLKVKYNKVFGYYIEISKAQAASAPSDYIRKQTLVNAERFITPELKELEAKVLGAEDRLIELHYELFVELREKVASRAVQLQENARRLGELDAIAGLAEMAAAKRLTRPEVDESGEIDIKGGWHPVIPELVKTERFVPNDVLLDGQEYQILIITGPNMAGKSTILRQTGLITIMAQMGSFVPAREARIGVVDRIFTRVGASDVLVRGMSTFMVEMTEAANILHNATDKSLVLLDEIGRGTSTFDGLSIAWAVAEFLHDAPGRRAKTMFATHYHELVDLAETRDRVKNYHVLVKEWEGEVIFLRRMVPGSTSRSYGIQVARLAGLPAEVIERAKEILENLESVEHDPAGKPAISKKAGEPRKKDGPVQLSFFPPSEPPADPVAEKVAGQIRDMDLDALTPLEALTLLHEMKAELKK